MQLTISAFVVLISFLIKPINIMGKDEYSETPSPEWIKYQQERNDPKYNRHNLKILQEQETSTIKTVTGNINAKSGQNVQDNVETNSRQQNNKKTNNDKEQELPMDDMDWENNEEESKSEQDMDSDDVGLKIPSISGFVNFLKSLKRTWFKKSLFRIDNKIQFLANLKSNLMQAIEHQFFNIWPEADPDYVENEGRHLRPKRGILEESNINFPPEAALLSINFLTFAVFLIKLVMQVVNIVKSKHLQFNALGFNTSSLQSG